MRCMCIAFMFLFLCVQASIIAEARIHEQKMELKSERRFASQDKHSVSEQNTRLPAAQAKGAIWRSLPDGTKCNESPYCCEQAVEECCEGRNLTGDHIRSASILDDSRQ